MVFLRTLLNSFWYRQEFSLLANLPLTRLDPLIMLRRSRGSLTSGCALLRRRGGPRSPAVAEGDQPGAGHLFQRAGAVQQRQPSQDILTMIRDHVEQVLRVGQVHGGGQEEAFVAPKSTSHLAPGRDHRGLP